MSAEKNKNGENVDRYSKLYSYLAASYDVKRLADRVRANLSDKNCLRRLAQAV